MIGAGAGAGAGAGVGEGAINMAQFRLHGKKALIIQAFNSMPHLIIDEYVYDGWTLKNWQNRLFKNNEKRNKEYK